MSTKKETEAIENAKYWEQKATQRNAELSESRDANVKLKHELEAVKNVPTPLSDVELYALAELVATHTVIASANVAGAGPMMHPMFGGWVPPRSLFSPPGKEARKRLQVELERRGILKSTDPID